MGSVVHNVPFGGPRPKPLPAADPIRIDAVARERAEGVVSDLCQTIGKVELYLSWLAGFVDEQSLGAAVVGSMGITAGELREQVPALKAAIRDIPDMDGGSAA